MNISISQLAPHPLNRLFDQVGEKWRAMVGSVKEHGVIQKPLVRPMEEGYQIVCGHRRVAAAEEAGLDEVCCDVREMDDRTVLEILIVENLERENPDPVEEGKLLRAAMAEGLEIEVLAHRLKRSVAWIETRQQLLDLGDEVLDAVKLPKDAPGHLGMGTVEVILSVPAEEREMAIQLVLHPEWTTEVLGPREAENVIRSVILEPARKKKAWEKESPGLVKAWRKALGVFLTKDEKKDLMVQAMRFEEVEGCKMQTPANAVIPIERLVVDSVTEEKRWVHLAIFHGLPVWVIPNEGTAEADMALAVVDERLIVLAETARAENCLPVTLMTEKGKKTKEDVKREERIEKAVEEMEGRGGSESGSGSEGEEEEPETVIEQAMESRAWVDLGPVRRLGKWALAGETNTEVTYASAPEGMPQWAVQMAREGRWMDLSDIAEWVMGLKR